MARNKAALKRTHSKRFAFTKRRFQTSAQDVQVVNMNFPASGFELTQAVSRMNRRSEEVNFRVRGVTWQGVQGISLDRAVWSGEFGVKPDGDGNYYNIKN